MKAAEQYLLFDTGDCGGLLPPSLASSSTPVYVSGRCCVCVCVCVCVYVCVGGFLLPWLVIFLFRGFTVTCSTTWTPGSSSEMRKEPRNGYVKAFSCRILPHLGEGPSFSGHPQTLLLWGLGGVLAIDTLPQWGVPSFTLMCDQDRRDFQNHYF